MWQFQAPIGPGSRLWAWGRLTVIWVVWVHGPHTGSMVDCVHPPFPPSSRWNKSRRLLLYWAWVHQLGS